MSLILSKRSLCEDHADYEALLPNITIVKSLVDCDDAGNLISGPSTQILQKLFNAADSDNSVWFTAGDTGDEAPTSCFKDTQVYYSEKSCNDACGFQSVTWTPHTDKCIDDAIADAFGALGGVEATTAPAVGNYTGPSLAIAGYDTFKEIVELFAAYLGNPALVGRPLNEVLGVLDAMCQLVEEKIRIKRSLRKAGLTIDPCDF